MGREGGKEGGRKGGRKGGRDRHTTHLLTGGELEVVDVELGVLRGLEIHAHVGGVGSGEGHGGQGDSEAAVRGGEEDAAGSSGGAV